MKLNLQNLQENIPLKSFTTFKVGGPARYLVTVKTEEELIAAVNAANNSSIPYYILGSGANVLVSDNGFDGLVILAKNDLMTITGTTVVAGSGVTIGKFVLTAVKEGLAGVECWAGIPGTIGGSIFGNMGLAAVERGEISDWVTQVTVLRDGVKTDLTNAECGFSYRHSNFKKNSDVILSATFELERATDPSALKEQMKQFQKKKLGEQPLEMPSSGCIFKNPSNAKAGQLIDQVGLKGKKIGGAQVSEKHANFIINNGSATAGDIIMLISLIKQKVRDEKQVQLEEEINYVGF